MPGSLSTRRQLRLTACVALFAWMFALLSGAVNACLIQPNPQSEPGSISSQVDPVAGKAAGTVAQQVQHGHPQGDDEPDGFGNHSSKAGCLKFCADESSAVTKNKSAQADLPGLIAVASLQWPPAVPGLVAAPWLAAERPASGGTPLFIRLLRLTI